MGQRNRDKKWPVPAATRHVWVSRADEGPHAAPLQGLVLEWRRHSYRWHAFVTVVLPTGVVIQQWVAAERLTPVKSDPNVRPPWGVMGR